jgi:hypothetical protein
VILLKRLCLLSLAILVIGAPIAESAFANDGPVAGAAKKKKKKKKCKKKSKKKGKAARKKGKCKKKRKASPISPSSSLPGKPVSPDPPAQPDPILLQSLTLSENPLLGGTAGAGQVTLSGPAPAGGQPVTLGTDVPSRATTPDAVHVAAGETTASFPVNTTAGPPITVVLTAAIDGSVRTRNLDLVDKAGLSSVALDYQCFPDTGLSNFGANVVSLNVRAPANEAVDLTSSDPFSLAVPSSVTVPSGSFTGIFGVDTLQTTPSVTVTASFDGIDRTDTASIRDSGSPAPVASTLSLVPNSVVVGDSSTGTISLDCEAPPGGTVVSLSTTYSGVTIPASVTIPQGELSATFPITTVISASAGDAEIDATAGATVPATLTLRAIGT